MHTTAVMPQFKRSHLMLAVSMVVCLIASIAFAIQAPDANSTFYAIYDVAVEKIWKGGLQYVVAFGLLVFGLMEIKKSPGTGIASIVIAVLAGTALSIVTAMGFTMM